MKDVKPIFKDHTGRWRPVNQEEKFDKLTMQEFIDEYSSNEFTKLLKLHGHEKIEDTHITKTSTYELEGACQSYGACSNCSGVSCCLVLVPNPVYNAIEQSIQYHEFPNPPEVNPGEVVMAYLQWQMKSRGTNEWNLFPAKYKTEYISSYNTYMLNGWIYDCRQIWILAPSPEASRGNDVDTLANEAYPFTNSLSRIMFDLLEVTGFQQSAFKEGWNARGKHNTPSDHITDIGVSAEEVLDILIDSLSGWTDRRKQKVLAAMEQYATLKSQSVLQDKEQQINDLISLNDQITETYTNQLSDKDKEIAGLKQALQLIEEKSDYIGVKEPSFREINELASNALKEKP